MKKKSDQPCGGCEGMSTALENRNNILVTEVCPESRSVEEHSVDAVKEIKEKLVGVKE